MTYRDSIEQTLYENWPEGLRRHSMPTVAHRLSRDDMLALGSVDPDFRARHRLPRVADFSKAFSAWLTAGLARFRGGAYLKTSYGSFRECPFTYKPVTTADEAYSILRWPDRRIGRHVAHRLDFGGDVHVLLRAWQPMPGWSEFRAFIHDRRIVGISQYHSQKAYPIIHGEAARIRHAVGSYLTDLIAEFGLVQIVVDLCVRLSGEGIAVGLIELSPFERETDPCLFDWSDPKGFDGRLRYRGPGGIMAA